MQKKKFVPGNLKHKNLEKEIPNSNITDKVPVQIDSKTDRQEKEQPENENRTLKLVGKSLSRNLKNKFLSCTVDLSDEKNQNAGTVTLEQSDSGPRDIILEFNIDGHLSTLKVKHSPNHITMSTASGNVIAAHPILAKYPEQKNLKVLSWNTTYTKDDDNVISWDTSGLDSSFTSVEVKQSFVMDGLQTIKCLNASYKFSN